MGLRGSGGDHEFGGCFGKLGARGEGEGAGGKGAGKADGGSGREPV